jgi:hypothetical protein
MALEVKMDCILWFTLFHSHMILTDQISQVGKVINIPDPQTVHSSTRKLCAVPVLPIESEESDLLAVVT